MIKINLLPSTKKKRAKKLTPLQQQLIVGAIILAVETGVLFFWWWDMSLTIEDLKEQKIEAEAKIAKQNSMLKEVKNVEDEKKKVLEKIDVIKKLMENQTGLVRLLDEVSRLLPKGVGLTVLSEKSGSVILEGNSFSNNDLVGFIDALKSSPMFSEVQLIVSEQKKLEGFDVYNFRLQFKFAYKGV